MCNLYDLGRARHQSRDEWEEAVAQVIRESEQALAASSSASPSRAPKLFGIRKTDPGLALTLERGEPAAHIMRWGFFRSYNPAVNNARSEKLDGTWSEPWQQKRRCLIPLSTFYEWQGPAGAKQAFAFQAPDRTESLWAAGIWEKTPEGLDDSSFSYSMLTRESTGRLSEIHHRMPVILTRDQIPEFLEAEDPQALLRVSRDDLEFFRCENPLKGIRDHEGPIRQDFLPGFDL
ncbi:MAG: SOS response-associated peptidase family protein [Verrucomicrobiales bacterium]|nr:SOS response-associated peptidase family protein [Verrucomicrobiales bacterium]